MDDTSGLPNIRNMTIFGKFPVIKTYDVQFLNLCKVFPTILSSFFDSLCFFSLSEKNDSLARAAQLARRHESSVIFFSIYVSVNSREPTNKSVTVQEVAGYSEIAPRRRENAN